MRNRKRRPCATRLRAGLAHWPWPWSGGIDSTASSAAPTIKSPSTTQSILWPARTPAWCITWSVRPLSGKAGWSRSSRPDSPSLMVFNSLTFLVFLAVVLVLYYRLNHRCQNLMLLVASYVFYGWWDYRFLSLLLFTSLFDYACALMIDAEARPGRRKLLLASSIVVNMGVLGIF